MTLLKRRRFVAITAAAGLAGPAAGAATAARWRGIALGARARMQLVGLTASDAAPIFAAIAAEIARLEDILSLYRPNSAICRLNRDGYLPAPPAELLQLCSLASALYHASDGAFDPTVQPLWSCLADAAATGAAPNPAKIDRAKTLVGWRSVDFDPDHIAFARPGMAITLNGIAQGFITDRVAEKLRSFGLSDVLIDIGEIRAWGRSPGGAPWRVGIAGAGGGCCAGRITLSDRALATSAPFGTVMDDANNIGHILDPRSGLTASNARQVSVSAPRADLADGLSTALCALEPTNGTTVLAGFPGARVENRMI